MGERITFWSGIALVALILATSYWYAQVLRAMDEPLAGHVGAVDFFADSAALTTFDEHGAPRYRLFADRLTHYGASDDVDLERPRLVSVRPGTPRVEVTARTAHSANNAETVHLQGDVVITRAADGPRAALRLETDDLMADPDHDHFWTAEPVTLRSGGDVVQARGMDYDNLARRVELFADVSGTFAPRRKR